MTGWPSEEQLRRMKEDGRTCLHQQGCPVCSCPLVPALVAPPRLDLVPPAALGPRSGSLSDQPGSHLDVRDDPAVVKKVIGPSYLCDDNRIHGDGSRQLPVLALGRQRRQWNRQLLHLLTLCFLSGLDGTAVSPVPEVPQGQDAESRPAVHHVIQLASVTLETSRRCLSSLPTRPLLSQGQSSPGSSWRSGIL